MLAAREMRTLTTAGVAHLCAYGDADDCKAQCDAGDAGSCANLASLCTTLDED